MKENVYRLVVLGDGGVGKTALTIQLCLNHFVETYDPTIEDSYRKQVVIDNQSCMLEVLDTAGQEEYTSLRDQWIRDGEGFVLVYSVTSRASFERIEKFYNLIQRVKESAGPSGYAGAQPSSSSAYRGPAPVMLVGNKSDRVTDKDISTQEGRILAGKLGCDFIEASAKNCVNVEKAFYDVVRRLRQQKSAASRPRAERRTTPTSYRPKSERGNSSRSGSGGKRRKEGGSKCVIL